MTNEYSSKAEAELTKRFTCSNMNCNQGHLMEVDDEGNYSDYGMCKCMEAILQATQAITDLITQAQIDELDNMLVIRHKVPITETYPAYVINQKVWNERKATLQSTLKKEQ